MFSCEFYKVFQNPDFIEHLETLVNNLKKCLMQKVILNILRDLKYLGNDNIIGS